MTLVVPNHGHSICLHWLYFFFLFKILFIFREGGTEGERGRETSMCGCHSCTPYWGPGPQPRNVPWLGIELATLWFTGCHSVHQATPARAEYTFLKQKVKQPSTLYKLRTRQCYLSPIFLASQINLKGKHTLQNKKWGSCKYMREQIPWKQLHKTALDIQILPNQKSYE